MIFFVIAFPSLFLDLFQSTEAAQVLAQSAAVAHGGVNTDGAVGIPGQSRASGREAGAAVDALLGKGFHPVGEDLIL